ncbi:sensor histidine kinase, partial [bacterium 1XD42-8]
MVFTDNKILIDLCGQINRLLLERQKIKSAFRKQEISSKKMLSNISHDIKTPLTVILGYLEMIRLSHEGDQALQKVEVKARQVLELINEFFTLAKLEAGDMKIEVRKININELCRESILSFYDILSGKNFMVDIFIPEDNLF